MKTDEQVQRAAQSVLETDSRVDRAGIDVTVDHQTNVREAIFEALERRAVKELHRIRIEEAAGVVTLSGTCQTWAEKKAVVGAARGTPGVRSVRDQLRIAP